MNCEKNFLKKMFNYFFAELYSDCFSFNSPFKLVNRSSIVYYRG